MADIATGTTLTWGGAITEIVSIDGPSMTNEPADTTNLSSTWRSFLAVIPDGGEVSLTLNYEPDAASHASFITDLAAGTLQEAVITFTDGGGTTLTFDAICTAFSPTASVGEKLSAAVTLKVTGDIA